MEVLAYSEMNDPARWFAFIFALFIVAAVLYIVDWKLIKKNQHRFMESEAKKRLYDHIIGEQTFELKTLIPMGIIFNLVAFWLIKSNPAIFLEQKYHLVLIFIQVLFELIVLMVAVNSFKKRSQFITESF